MNDYFSMQSVPLIRRARGYFLYTPDGRRFLDFYQDNGRAVLGHRSSGMQRVIKSTVSKGLLAPYPSVYSGKAESMIKKLFPEASLIRIYRNGERMRNALADSLNRSVDIADIKDPLQDSESDIKLWRPFLDNQKGKASFIIPVFPFPGDFAPQVVVAFNKNTALHKSDSVSPFLLDSLVKAVSGLIHALSISPEQDLSVFDSTLWERKGRYLISNLDTDRYREFYERALDAGVFLPPSSELPGIIPLEYESGQIKKFLTLMKEMQ